MRERSTTTPKAGAAHFVRVGFLHYTIGHVWRAAGMRWRFATRKTGNGKVERAPKQVYRAALPGIFGPETGEYRIYFHQRLPVQVHLYRIVGFMYFILHEWNGGIKLVGFGVDGYVYAHCLQFFK